MAPVAPIFAEISKLVDNGLTTIIPCNTLVVKVPLVIITSYEYLPGGILTEVDAGSDNSMFPEAAGLGMVTVIAYTFNPE